MCVQSHVHKSNIYRHLYFILIFSRSADLHLLKAYNAMYVTVGATVVLFHTLLDNQKKSRL